jgi:hypothetical protein
MFYYTYVLRSEVNNDQTEDYEKDEEVTTSLTQGVLFVSF